jgi:hypothetical protein
MHGFTLIALIALLTVLQISAGATEKYHMVIVPNPTDHIMRTIAELGIPLDCGVRMIKDQGLELPLSDSEIALLNSRGILYRITQPDLESYYSAICRENMKNIPIQTDTDPIHMKYGSMGGFYTWVQIVADLDSMNLLYSNLAAPKVVIGQGHNSNPVYMVKISDNPGVQETEPEGEFDATIHAREPGSYTSLMYAMWWLLENYGTDQEATYLVNNRQLYFVPVVNPDGFLQNIQTNPGGGGMWRKNRRFNNPSYGVDCNRNFTYQWGYDNSGSSPTPSSETYRGPSAGSEPETQAVMNLITAHTIKVSNSMHTYAGVYLSPYGYAPVLPPVADHQAFMEYMSTACEGGGYNFGPVNSPLMYAVNGGSVDWAYHDRNSIATTVEVGTVSFWPPIGNIFPDAQKNLPGLLYQFWVAGARIEGTDLAISDGYLTPGQTENLVATIKNMGQTTSEPFTYELTTNDPYVTVTPNVISVSSLINRTTTNNAGNPFVAQVSASCPAGHSAVVNLVIHQGSYTRTKSYTLPVGAPTVLFSDNGESGMGNWTASGGWALTTSTSHSPSNSFADSPTGNYSSSTTRYLTLTQNLNLSGVTAAWLDFWTRWEIEGGWDFAQLEVSTNNGTSWTAIPGLYTTLGTGQGIQTLNQPGYDGAQYTFVHERMNLAAYAGQAQFKFRFKLRSDSGFNLDGWYVDDIQVVGYSGTTAPNLDVVMTPLSPPIVIPANGGSFQFNATVQRTQAPQTAFWAWARNRYPSGTYSGTLLGPVNINPPVGVTVTRTRTQVVDAAWPAGVNYYVGYAHSSVAYPATDADSFSWTKSATADGGAYVWEVANYGEEFPYLVGGSSAPQSFALIGASPNPFNPTTAISYQLSANSFVSLKVYNTAGRLVSTLVNGQREAGSYQVTFDGSHLASGVYLYSLTAGSNHATGKMVLMK